MRFSEFKELLFNFFFQPFEIEGIKYNNESCDTLTYNFNECKILNGRLIDDGVDCDLLERIDLYVKTYENMKDGHSEELVPRSVEKSISADCGIKRSVDVPREKVEGMSFYTIVPRKRLPFNEVEVSRITKCAKKLFQNEKIIEFSHFCVESGKHKNKPNLHIHCLCKFKKGKGKNFARDLQKIWKSFYPNKAYNIAYKEVKKGKLNVGVDRVPCNTLQIQKDKRAYLVNANKGSHENFCDLKINEVFQV